MSSLKMEIKHFRKFAPENCHSKQNISRLTKKEIGNKIDFYKNQHIYGWYFEISLEWKNLIIIELCFEKKNCIDLCLCLWKNQ